ncbi:MAG: ABC transporter ATP-binding protein [Desulfurivibrionaceae bacterium]
MTSNDQDILSIRELSKKFGTYQAVNRVSLSVRSGQIVGFLGPNGAGKTTTIKIAAGLLKPDSGAVGIAGHDMAHEPARGKQKTGYIPDRPYLYEKLTGEEFLQFTASLYNVPEKRYHEHSERLLDLLDLTEWRHHLIESFSHGMRQKLIITAAFMPDPPLILVDEPMVGLDPKGARIVKELFREHARRGGGIFLSTHSLEVAEELCDYIAIILKGAIRSQGLLSDLRREAKVHDTGLEEIFLQLTGTPELSEVIKSLQND